MTSYGHLSGSCVKAVSVKPLEAWPTISARIQALEQTVGGPLFLRSSRKLVLTERGESFLPYARRALAVLDAGILAAQLTQEGMRGRVSLQMITKPMARLLPTLSRTRSQCLRIHSFCFPSWS